MAKDVERVAANFDSAHAREPIDDVKRAALRRKDKGLSPASEILSAPKFAAPKNEADKAAFARFEQPRFDGREKTSAKERYKSSPLAPVKSAAVDSSHHRAARPMAHAAPPDQFAISSFTHAPIKPFAQHTARAASSAPLILETPARQTIPDAVPAAAPDAVPAPVSAPVATIAEATPEERALAPTAAASAPSAAERPDAASNSPTSPQAPQTDFERFAVNAARMIEEGAKVINAAMKPLQSGQPPAAGEEVSDAVRVLGKVAEYWIADPRRAMQAQTAINTKFLEIWGNTFRRMTGEEVEPAVPYDPRDKRFADPQWRESPLFDFFRQTYAMTVDWVNNLVSRNEEIDDFTRAKAAFYVRQVAAALSPSNFIGTNPELLRATIQQEGENLVRGLQMLAEDIEAGKGSLRLRQADNSKFQLGVNMALTPGKVIWRNALIELIQYEPTTPQVYKRPLLIVPPWINKFYILDLNKEKSFIRWAVEQGLTVFVISWVNPDERHADKGFSEYMREGLFESLDVIHEVCGEEKVSAIGYCVGGTLLATSLAYMAAKGDRRIESATFFTTQVDFTDPGDLKVFTDDATIKAVEERMKDVGYLDGSQMANAFNMLRPNDLIWSYVVNNYLKGQQPLPFDLLTWNSDSTRMTRANHSFYLRECYLANNLAKGRMTIDGVKLNLGDVKIPIYELAAKEDHIAPAKSAFVGAKLFGGEVKYVMAGSGHIAGVVNPPGPKPKYQYWTGPAPKDMSFEEWRVQAKETPGSWWPDWIKWMREQAPEMVAARAPGGGKFALLGDAPGEYVKMKC